MRKIIAFVTSLMVLASMFAIPVSATAPRITVKTVDGGLVETMDDYVFVPDDEAVGDWAVYDYVRTIDGFNPAQRFWQGDLDHYVGNSFYPDGRTIMYFGDGDTATYEWTKGYIIWDSVVPEYEIKNINGNIFMFVQWKTGDYSFRGVAPSYYVFIKTSNEPAAVSISAELMELRDEVYAEYERWNSIPYDQRQTPTNLRVPFRVMVLIYTDTLRDGRPHTMTSGARQRTLDGMADFKKFVEGSTSNNVNIIWEHKIIDRQMELTPTDDDYFGGYYPLHHHEVLAEINKHAPADEYNFVFTVAENNLERDNGFQAYGVEQGQGYASVNIARNGVLQWAYSNDHRGAGGIFVHEFLHAFEFSRYLNFLPGIEMPWTHIAAAISGIDGASQSDFPGYEWYFNPNNLRNDPAFHNSNRTYMDVLDALFLRADIKYTDPKTKEMKYVGIYPSMWRYIVEWQAHLANNPLSAPTFDGVTPEQQKQMDLVDQSTVSNWAQNDVKKAIYLGLLNITYGIGDMSKDIIRQEFAIYVVTLYEKIAKKEIQIGDDWAATETNGIKWTGEGSQPFVDVTETLYHIAVALIKANKIGVINGVQKSDGLYFNQGESLTREQAATMLYRLAEAVGKPLPKATSTFADNGSISDWALDAIGAVQAAGIMNGNGGNFDPQGSYTREQSIVTILRLYEYVSGGTIFLTEIGNT